MKASHSQKSFFLRSFSRDGKKNISTNLTVYSDLNKCNSKDTKMIKNTKIKEYDKNIKFCSDLINYNQLSKTKTKVSLHNLPTISKYKPLKVRNFSLVNLNIQNEIIKTVCQRNLSGKEIMINNEDESSSDSKRSMNPEENNSVLLSKKNSSKKGLNLKSLEILNQNGLNTLYKDLINYSNYSKESLIDSIYIKLCSKNIQNNQLLNSLHKDLKTKKEDNPKRQNLFFKNSSPNINRIQQVKDERIELHHFMKNQDSWREINSNISFPYFIQDPDLLVKIMDQNAENLKLTYNFS